MSALKIFEHDIVVVGGGLASMRAAIEAGRYADVAIVTQTHPLRSHSGAAQGGINAPLANHPESKDDSPEKHAFDTVKGSDYLADQDAVEIFTKDAPERIYELEHWGCPFSRFEDGRIGQRPFGGAGYPRTCFAADRTGHVILHTLFEQCVKNNVRVYLDRQVIDLAVDGGRSRGVLAVNLLEGTLEGYQSKAVVFGTGGLGRLFARTTNGLTTTGLGMAIPYWNDVPLKDMEFVQFHPTGLYGASILMTEGARGEGGYLVNNKGERFMKNYAPEKMELGPRDIVARSIWTEIEQGRGFEGGYVHLDLRHLGKEKILERLPSIREISMDFAGVDPIEQPIPIVPTQHYIMGGIDTDKDGATILPGLYAAGECACVSVHGANRLGGNSLLDTIVFGQRAGNAAAGYANSLGAQEAISGVFENVAKKWNDKFDSWFSNENGENPMNLRVELGDILEKSAFIFRNEKDMSDAIPKIRNLKKRFENISLKKRTLKYNIRLIRTIDLEGMLDIGEAMLAGALARKESRGSHYRRDFEKRDDENWLKHTMALPDNGGVKLSYKPVTITKWQPMERKY
jgi:succinate dehydrogenase / fumarate reductase flavoprotein subunit